MNLDLEAKELNNSMMVGFIGYARYYDITKDIVDEININFNNIKYKGKFITNSNDCAYGAGLIGYLYGPHNNMTSTVQGNKLNVNINNFDFTSEEIKSTGNGTIRVSSTINQVLFQGNRGYINKDVADALKNSNDVIADIREKSSMLLGTVSDEKGSIDKLVETYSVSNKLLQKIVEIPPFFAHSCFVLA